MHLDIDTAALTTFLSKRRDLERWKRINRHLHPKPPLPEVVKYDVPIDRSFQRPFDQFPTDKTVLRYHGNCTSPPMMPTQDEDLCYAVRCRNCPSCIRSRRYLWRLRAELETLEAPETVMMTLTFAEQHREREVAERAVTKYLYRLRKNLTYRIRYLACFELTKAGAWHVHMLIHGPKYQHRNTLRKYWTDGYSWARVADLGAAGYVTKYVTKDMDQGAGKRPRVRASRNPRYGDGVMQHEKDLVQVLRGAQQVNDSKVWTSNAAELLQLVAKEREPDIWQQINQTKEMWHLLEDGRSLNEMTGEIRTNQ